MSGYRTAYPRLRASIELGVTVESDAPDESGEAARRFRDHLENHPEDFDWLASWLAGEGFGKADDFPLPLPPAVPLDPIRGVTGIVPSADPDQLPAPTAPGVAGQGWSDEDLTRLDIQ